MPLSAPITRLVIATLAATLLGGCFMDANLRDWDDTLGQGIDRLRTSEALHPDTSSSTPGAIVGAAARDIVLKLSEDERARIDAWLASSGLNRFGDPLETIYASGTPLIDQAGKNIERFEYVITKHPEVLEAIGVKQ